MHLFIPRSVANNGRNLARPAQTSPSTMAGDTPEGCESNTVRQAPDTPSQGSIEMSTKEMDSKGIDAQKEEKIRDLQALHGKATQELDALLRKCIKEVEEGHELLEAHKGGFNQLVMGFKDATSRVIRPSEAEEESIVGAPVTESDIDAAGFSKDGPMAMVKEEKPFRVTMGHATPSPKPNSKFKSFPWLSKGGPGPMPAPFSPGVRQKPANETCPSGPSNTPPKRHRAGSDGNTPRKFPKLD